MLRGPGTGVQSEINQLSEFHLPPVAAGTYELTLQLPEVEVVIPDLVVGS